METRANYLLVGFFVILFALGFLAFVVWLAKVQIDTTFAHYDIIYRGSVTGLKEGSPVRFSGVRVGQAVEIRLDPDDPSQVRVTIEVERLTPVRSDTKASLEFEGLTGGRYILLHGGDPQAPALTSDTDGERPAIVARASSLEKVLEGAPEVLESVNLLLVRAIDLLNDKNREQAALVLENMALLTTTVSDKRQEIEALIDDSATAMVHLRSASAAVEGLVQGLSKDRQRIVDQTERTLVSVESLTASAEVAVTEISADLGTLIGTLDSAGRNFERALGQIEAMVAENREPLRDFSATGLYEFSALLTESRSLVRELATLTSEVQRDPARFFFGDRQQGYETQECALGLGALAPLGACAGVLPGQGPPEALYRLTPKSTFSGELPHVDWQLVIEKPISNGSLDTTRIALQQTPTRVEYFANAGWVDRAPAMIQTLMVESFENSNSIVAVGRETVGLRSDFVLKIELREFTAVYYEGLPPQAVVALILRLVEMPRRAIIGAERIGSSIRAEKDSLEAVLDAFDVALGKVLKRSVEWTVHTGEGAWRMGVG
jgi:phospholipid/cholesterol/gamma-HCH transport system substrate-binding protein